MFYKIKNKINETVKKIINFDDSHEFKPILSEIEDAPVSPLGRSMFWIITSLIIITVLWLCLGKVDIVVTARGIVIPDGEAKIIQPLDTGVISNIRVKEGDFVKKGQVLMEIDPSATEPAVESSQKNLDNINLEIQRLDATSEGTAFLPEINVPDKTTEVQKNLYKSDLDALNQQLIIKQTELYKIDEQLKAVEAEKTANEEVLNSLLQKEQRMKKVLDIIAYNDYEDVVNQIKGYKASVAKSNGQISDITSQKQQTINEIAYIKASFKSKNLESLAEKQKQATELKSNVEQIKFRNSKQKIVAPCDGFIDKLFVHTNGGVVTPAEQLIALTPSNTPLMIKATVLNQDIGFVKEKMPVSVKIDTFNFQKYGILKGEVKSISKNSLMDEKLGPIYEVYVTPITKTLKVEGENQSIQTGMSLSAEIKVGKRRIIEFFIYPLIKYLDEGISVR